MKVFLITLFFYQVILKPYSENNTLLHSFSVSNEVFFLCGLNYYNISTQSGMCRLTLFQAKQNKKAPRQLQLFL